MCVCETQAVVLQQDVVGSIDVHKMDDVFLYFRSFNIDTLTSGLLHVSDLHLQSETEHYVCLRCTEEAGLESRTRTRIHVETF